MLAFINGQGSLYIGFRSREPMLCYSCRQGNQSVSQCEAADSDRKSNIENKAAVAFVAFIAGLVGVFFTSYMVGGHSQNHIVELLIAQFIGNGLLAAILATLLLLR